MKRLLCLVSALCLTALVLSGCGETKGESSSGTLSAVPTAAPTALPQQKAKAVKIKADSGLNVRATASTEGEILGLADTGSMLALLVEDEKDGWYQVQYEGKPAYVSAEYVEIKEVTLEEYNKLKDGASSGENSSGTSSQTSSVSSKPEASGSSKASDSSSPDSSLVSDDSEDGE